MGVVSSNMVRLWLPYSWKGKYMSKILLSCCCCHHCSLWLDYFIAHSFLFLFLSIIGLRQWLVRIMPQSLVLAVGAGIGLFIAWVSSVPEICLFTRFISVVLLGCVSTQSRSAWFFLVLSPIANHGLGVIGGDTTNFVGLGGCNPESTLGVYSRISVVYFWSADYASSTLQYYCARGALRSPTMWLGIFVGGY